jgi:hypothetical protein
MPMTVSEPKKGPSPYFATTTTGPAPLAPEPTAPDVSSYHAMAATPALPVPAGKPAPSASPYNGAPSPIITGRSLPVPPPAPLPAPTAMPSVPMKTRPMPAPAAPVVPATMPAADVEKVKILLTTAKGPGAVEERKASIKELVQMKANTPEVLAALEMLSDDAAPAVRTEAVIAGARLKMGR